MPVIDSDGLFGGDRFDLMTDEARLYWPHFWCASNTVGRIELNYLKVTAKAFSRFKKPPTEEKFRSMIGQYRDAYLLFVYSHNGQSWGQWDTSEKFLPRHKLSADERTPAPNAGEFLEWRKAYVEIKSAKSIPVTNFVNISEIVPKDLGNISEEFRTNVRGIGIGIGSGIGKNNTVAAEAADFVSWFNSEFWPAYPRKVAKPEAFKAARKFGKSESDRAEIVAGLKAQLPAMREKDPQYIPHPSTWINQQRWKDSANQSIVEEKPYGCPVCKLVPCVCFERHMEKENAKAATL